jgi:quercetin dioxygenase-like cupin family protein
VTEATEAVARAAFAAAGLEPSAWSNGPGATYAEHDHPRDKLLFCIEGSIVFATPDGSISLHPGDRLDLPAGIPHTAIVGPDGVTCWEAYPS